MCFLYGQCWGEWDEAVIEGGNPGEICPGARLVVGENQLISHVVVVYTLLDLLARLCVIGV